MTKIILQPIGNENSIDDFKENNSKRWAEKGKYKKFWEKSDGATVLFTHDSIVFAKATISSIRNSGHKKYPLDYSYNDIKYMNIPFSKIRNMANFSSPYRNYTVLDEKASQVILDYFELSTSHVYTRDEDYQKDIHSAKLFDIKDEPERPKEVKKESGKRYYPRNKYRASLALSRAEYQCEIDSSHTTFTSQASKENYVEAHHLFPLKAQDIINYNLDVTPNIISLCPNCHRKIHLASFEHKENMLKTLYEKHIEGLKKVKLNRGLEDLYAIYKDLNLYEEY